MAGELEGIVKKSTGKWYQVLAPDGHVYECHLAGKHRLYEKDTTNPLAVGDQVLFKKEEQKPGWIYSKKRRSTEIVRHSHKAGSFYHIIAANVSQLVIIASIKQPRTSQGFIDRLLVSAETEEITPLIVFNKKDERTKAQEKSFQRLYNIYSDIGYQVFNTSAETGEGLPDLEKALENHTSLLAGHSGVGKSSLLNYINPELNLKTRPISKATQKGKHATTFAEMHPLKESAFVIDAPGIKDFGLTDLEKPMLSHFFREMKPYVNECRFNDCLHNEEPGCKVKEQTEQGVISSERYNSYLRILENMH